MSKFYESVMSALSRGPRSTEEIVTECKRAGLSCRPETIALFLELQARDVDRQETVPWHKQKGVQST